MSAPAEDFADLGCGVCGEDVDENGVCIDCGYDPLEEYFEMDDWRDIDYGPTEQLAELGPVGKEALG